MKAITIDSERNFVFRELPDPEPGPGRVVIDIHAAGVNRADLLQRAGKYPPPPGWPDWPGLECAGVIARTCPGSRWNVGDKVCALLGGGGYAEKAAVPEDMVMPVPAGLSLVEAASLPEVYATAFLNLVLIGGLKAGQTAFVQAGASGLGIAAIGLAKMLGARVATTVGSEEKAAAVRALGADTVILRRTEDVAAKLTENPPDVALDCAGGALLGACLNAMKPGGTWILVSTLGGETAEIPLRVVLKKHLRLVGSTLRSRSDAEKGTILKRLAAEIWPGFADGRLAPHIDQVFPAADVAQAHAVLEHQRNIGKVVLQFRGE